MSKTAHDSTARPNISFASISLIIVVFASFGRSLPATSQEITNVIVDFAAKPPNATLYGLGLGSAPGEIVFAIAGQGQAAELIGDWTANKLTFELPTTTAGDYLVAVQTQSGGSAFYDLTVGSQVAVANFAPPAETGQSECFDLAGVPILCAGTGMDGELRLGVKWPTPRWQDRQDGTVLDQLTGLIWLRDWECFQTANWDVAMDLAKTLEDGVCGLSGNYRPGDFVPPTINQLMSVLDYGEESGFPADFPMVFVPGDVWSSTTYQPLPSQAWTLGATSAVQSYQVPKAKDQGNRVTAIYRPTL